MKQIKLYEGFIADLQREQDASIDKYLKLIENSLQILIDDYELEFRYYDESYCFIIDRKFDVTAEFMKELAMADRKLRQNGSFIQVKDFHYMAIELNGYGTGLKNAVNSGRTVDDFIKLINKYKEVTITTDGGSFMINVVDL
jgi:hypothetical protein